MSKFIGSAPVNAVYRFAKDVTRCEYATLAEMARNAGDLAFAVVGKRTTRLSRLAELGFVRRNGLLRRWELTANGWALLVGAENALLLACEA